MSLSLDKIKVSFDSEKEAFAFDNKINNQMYSFVDRTDVVIDPGCAPNSTLSTLSELGVKRVKVIGSDTRYRWQIWDIS